MAVLDSTPKTIKNFLQYDKQYKLWNPLFDSFAQVEEISRDTDIAYITTPMFGPILPRDFCCIRFSRDTMEKGYVIGMKSIFHSDKPETQKYIRGDLSIQGYVIRPHKTKENTSILYHIIIADLRGWLPNRVVDLLAETQAKIMNNIRTRLACEEKLLSYIPDRSSDAYLSPATSPSLSRGRGGTRGVSKNEHETDVSRLLNEATSNVRTSSGNSRKATSADGASLYGNLLPRIQTSDLPVDSLMENYDEFIQNWRSLLVTAVDLHLEDRIAEAASVLQAVLRSVEHHRTYVQEHIDEDEFWKKDCELAKIIQILERNPYVSKIQNDLMDAEIWINELQNRQGWQSVSLHEDMQIWTRIEAEQGFPSFLCEASVASPIADCFSVLSEVDQIDHWAPKYGSQNILTTKIIAHLTRMSKIVHTDINIPFLMKNKEFLGLVRGMDILDRGYIILFIRSIEEFEGIELPEKQPSRDRVQLNAVVMISPTSKSHTHITFFASVDLADIYPYISPLRVWLIRKICESIFSMIREQCEDIIGSDFEMIMANNPDLYNFIQARSTYFVEHTVSMSPENMFDAIILHTR